MNNDKNHRIEIRSPSSREHTCSKWFQFICSRNSWWKKQKTKKYGKLDRCIFFTLFNFCHNRPHRLERVDGVHIYSIHSHCSCCTSNFTVEQDLDYTANKTPNHTHTHTPFARALVRQVRVSLWLFFFLCVLPLKSNSRRIIVKCLVVLKLVYG